MRGATKEKGHNVGKETRKLRIGIACHPTYGGSGIVAGELALLLAERGHEVHVFSNSLPIRLRNFQDRLYFHEIGGESYALFKYPLVTLTGACKMAEISCSAKLDVLHAHYAIPWAVCALLAREVAVENACGCAPKVVTTLHGTDITLVGNAPSFFSMTRFGIRRSDAVTAVSDYLRRKTLETFNLPETTNIEVVHNSVDAARFRPFKDSEAARAAALRAKLAPRGEKLLVHVSNFRPVKNIPDVLKVFVRVRRNLSCRLILIGEGPELPRARKMVAAEGVTDDVLFLGNQDLESVAEILACADLFLLPSGHESFGLAALEAMACGVPVLATEIGGLREVVTDGEDGWLCCVGDICCMAHRALTLLTDEVERKRMGAAAEKKAVERFSPEKFVAAYEAIYYRVRGE